MQRNAHRDLTKKGLKWSLLSQVFTQITTLVVGIILARLLSPEEFGLIGMVTVITGFATVINDFGFGSALIQKKDITENDLSSVFWLNLILSTSVALLVCAAAVPISRFYGIPLLENITYALSLPFLFTGLGLVQKSQLVKRLDFKRQFRINLTATLLSSFIAIYLAYTDWGVWSLVWKQVINSFVLMLMYWLIGKWKPNTVFHKETIREIMNFSLPLFGTNALNYWTRNLDNLLIGKFIGSEALGYYGRAYTFMLLPVRQVSGIISKVLFPSFSMIQDDVQSIKNIYLKVSRNIALLTFPLMFGLSAVAEPFVLSLLGNKWQGVIPVLQILAVVGATQSITSLNGNIFMARGQTKLLFKIGLIFKSIVILSIVIGLQYGIIGVAIGYSLASVVLMFPLFIIMGKLIDLRLSQILFNLSPYFIAAFVMAGSIYSLDFYIKSAVPGNLFRLIIEGILGIILYSFINVIFKTKAWLEAKDLILRR